MPLSFPLSYAEFMGVLPISGVVMDCPEVVEMSQTAGGEVLADEIGNRYWQGEVKLGRMMRYEKREAQVLFDEVRGAGGSFFVNDVAQEYPQDDPDGAGLAGLTPQIASLPSDARLISLKGLPNYTLRRGDHLAFEYRSAPIRYALHRVVDSVVSTQGSGVTPVFQVQPHIQPGATVDTAVQLIRPACKAIILPDGVQRGSTTRFIHEGMSFRFMQTLR